MTRFGATSAPWFRRAWTALVGAWALVAAPRGAAAEVGALVVLPASGRGVSAPIVQYVRTLFVQDLSGAHHGLVIDYDRPPVAVQLDARTLSSVAASVGGRLALALDVSRDAGVTTLDLTCTDAATAATACHARESTVAGPEVLPELTRAVAAHAVEELDARAGRRPRAPLASHVLRVGARALVTAPLVTVGAGPRLLGGAGFTATINAGSSFVDLIADVAGGDDRRTFGVGAGFSSWLAEGARAPFVGASAHWVGQSFGGRGAAGGQLRATAGYAWGRDELVESRVDVSYFVDLFEERTLDRLIVGSDATYRSHGLVVALGVAF